MPGIVAHLFPSADDVQAGGDRRQKAGDLARVVLQVGVERHHELAARGPKTGTEGGGFAKISPEPQAADSRIFDGQAANLPPRTVGRAIIDENQLDIISLVTGHTH